MAGPAIPAPRLSGALAPRAVSPPVAVRRAAAGDAGALARIDRAGSRSPWSLARIARACGPGGPEEVLVAVCGGRVEGFVVFCRVLDEASIHQLTVRRSRRGRGIGGALLDAALARLRDGGVARCLLEVRASNEAALALYTRRGFTRDGRRRGYYRGDAGTEDALLLSARLRRGQAPGGVR